jgi:hypothetical protein
MYIHTVGRCVFVLGVINLRQEMKEMVKQIKTDASSRVKEVIQQNVKEMIGKMDSIIEEAMRTEDYTPGKMKTMKGKPT